MTKFQKKKAIIGAIVAGLGALTPLILKLIPDKPKSIYIPSGGFTIEQRIVGDGGGGNTGVTIEKGITIRKITN